VAFPDKHETPETFQRSRPALVLTRCSKSSELTAGPLRASFVASDAAIEAALESVKLIEGICEEGCEVGNRFAVHPPAWISRAPAAVFRRERLTLPTVWAWLWGLPTGSVTSGNRQPATSDVVHDHVRLRQHQSGL
jgi:hypothetical protein